MDLHVLLPRRIRIVFFWLNQNHCDPSISVLQQNYVISSKIKIGLEYDKTDFSTHFGFYTNYSRFILKVLKKSSFQEFLCSMLLAENIEEKIVNTVDIKVFPAPRKNGFNIVGKCDIFRGRIRIYPKTFNYC